MLREFPRRPKADGSPSWERPVQWTASGLPFDLRAVRYVLAASELLSFSKVAYALDATVSTVSRSIRDLEDSLGVSLFQRSTMGVRLTNAGARFLDNVSPAIIQIESAIQHAGSAGRVEDGVVRVGTNGATKAYNAAMRKVQDDYYEAVGKPCGLLRHGPRQARKSTRQYAAEQKQAKLMAEEMERLERQRQE